MPKSQKLLQSETDRERDRELVRRVLAGDQEAFSEIYNANFRRIYAFIVKRVGDAAEAPRISRRKPSFSSTAHSAPTRADRVC